MLLQLGLNPIESNKFAKGSGTRRITLGLEFHADLVFWRLLIFDGLGSVGGTLGAPLIWSFPQTPTYTLWSDASGDAMGGWFLEAGASSGVWWRYEFDVDVRSRVREKVNRRDDLSINVLELLGMVVGAWVFLIYRPRPDRRMPEIPFACVGTTQAR